MIDKFDYAEPRCPLCNGKDFYYPKADAPLGTVPIGRIIDKLGSLFAKNDYEEAGRLLRYWHGEAISLGDRGGELSVLNELIGYYRKQNDKEKGLDAVSRALALVSELSQETMASGATVFLNCATAYKAFSMPNEAMELYTRAENIYKNVLAPSDERLAGLYNNMATALCDLGKFEEAELAYFTALAILEEHEGSEPERAVTYINLAELYELSGQEAFIPDSLTQAFKLLTKEDVAHDGNYAFVLEKCAPAFKHFGDTDTYLKFKKEYERIYAGA